MDKLSIIIPTYNEKDNIKILVKKIEDSVKDIEHEIIFVDDSNDGTDKEIKKEQKNNSNIVLNHRIDKKGLSSAVIDGIEISTGNIIAVMDADLQHPPHLLKQMYDEIVNGVDICIPSRFITGGNDGGLNLYRKAVSATARYIAKIFIPNLYKISDITSGIFCFRKDILDKNYKLNPIGWKIMLEVLCKSNYKIISEIPYRFDQRNACNSKMNKKVMLEYLKQVKILRKEKIKNNYKVIRRSDKNEKN